MNGIIRWFIENRVAANMLMLLILVAGFLVIPQTQKEIFPDLSFNEIRITAAYPGTSPSEVEEAVCSRIERATATVKGISRIHSVAVAQTCNVTARVEFSANFRSVLEQVKAKVDAIPNFPAGVQRPIVSEVVLNKQAGRIIIFGNADGRSLKTLAENVRDDLADLGITQVTIDNAQEYEIGIEVSESALQKYNISFSEISQAIKSNSVQASGGSVETSGGVIAVETGANARNADDFRNLVLRADPDGGHLTLGDIAEVNDGLQQTNSKSLYNGLPTVSLVISTSGSVPMLETSQRIRKYVKDPRTKMPEGVTMVIGADQAMYFKSRIDLLGENALLGLALVFMTLMLFLRTQLAFWVSVGIPIAFMGGLLLLHAFGQSINMISTFGLLLVLGIVVDDAIIVAENIYNNQQGKLNSVQGAIAGTQQIAKPVIFAVVTTAVTFVPLIFLPGTNGKLLISLPVIVLATLLFSLVESLLILPAHLSHFKRVKEPKENRITRIQSRFNAQLERALNKYYRPLLDLVLAYRYAAFAGFMATLILTFSLLSGGWVDVKWSPEIEGEQLYAPISFPQGTSAQVTEEAVMKMGRALDQVNEELTEEYGRKQVSFVRYGIASPADHKGYIIANLVTADSRDISGEQLAKRWREAIGEIEQATELSIEFSFNQPGPPINIQLASQNPSELKAAADALADHLRTYPETYDIQNSYQDGQKTVQLDLKPNAYDLGLNKTHLAAQVREAFQGVQVQSIQRNQGEVKVVIRYPKDERSSLWNLENMRIRLADGSHVPLMTVADVYYAQSPSTIIRTNGRRVLNVTSFVDLSMSSPGNIMRSVHNNFLSDIENQFPSVRWNISGTQEDEREVKDYLAFSFLTAIAVMYMLMATLFRSYSQPLLVLTAIPFGIIGAMFGHLLMGYELTLLSAVGIVAVSGIVVNDNMVLIFFINDKREKGEILFDAVRSAGIARFRPIILTSMTTFIGLAPLVFEGSWEAQFLIPMAISIAYGVLFATAVSLLLIPALYLILDDISRIKHVKQVITRLKSSHEDEEDLRYDDDGIIDDFK